MSIVAAYETYRDRVYGLLNEWFPIQHSLDVLTGEVPNPIEEILERGRAEVAGGLEFAEPDDSGEVADDEEVEDDEFSDG